MTHHLKAARRDPHNLPALSNRDSRVLKAIKITQQPHVFATQPTLNADRVSSDLC